MGGLRSPEAAMLVRVITYGTRRREVVFMHLIRLSSCLLSTKICSALDVKPRLSRQRVLSQLKTTAQCLAYSMREFEALGASSSLKLLAADLWTLFWSILFICFMWLISCLLFLKLCLVLDVKPRHLHQHALSQLKTTAQSSTHTMYRRLRQDEVLL